MGIRLMHSADVVCGFASQCGSRERVLLVLLVLVIPYVCVVFVLCGCVCVCVCVCVCCVRFGPLGVIRDSCGHCLQSSINASDGTRYSHKAW
jgi:hypothetical protein